MSQERDQSAVKIMKFFFDELVADEEIGPDLAPDILPEYFLVWVESNISNYTPEDVMEKAGATLAGWEYLQEVLHNAGGVLMIQTVWPRIAYSHRKPPEHKLKRVQSSLALHYEDGTIVPITINLPIGVLTEEFTDGVLLSQLVVWQKVFTEQCRAGIDALYKIGDNHGGDYPYEVLMGALLQIIPQMRPEIQENLKKYARLAQGLINPPLPPAVKELLKQREAERARKGPQQGPPLKGGWSE